MDRRQNAGADRLRGSNPITVKVLELYRREISTRLCQSSIKLPKSRTYVDSTQPRISRDTTIIGNDGRVIQESNRPGLWELFLDANECTPVKRLDISSIGITTLLENWYDVVDVSLEGQGFVRTYRVQFSLWVLGYNLCGKGQSAESPPS